jgi:hypothetical protein
MEFAIEFYNGTGKGKSRERKMEAKRRETKRI